MENGWSLFNTSITATTNTNTTNNNSTTTTSSSRGHNGHCNNLAWDIWDMGTSRFDWNTTTSTSFHHHHQQQQQQQQQPPSSATVTAASEAHALMLGHQTAASLYSGAAGPHYYHPDPHLMCLKLGKRHYFEDATGAPLGDCHVVGGGGGKRGKTYYGGGGGGEVVGTSAPVPRCQVDGCHVALVNAKEYHRRHKVCEMHSKAPKVEVLGLEQRFCQQCSRFHEVSEFDDSKRSCRRRLAGHNERRRKGSHDSIPRSHHPSLSHENKLMAERFSYLTLPTGRALSLLSSSSWKNNSWFSSSDLSLRCSAALRELIAENRAAILARQLVLERDWHRESHDTMDDVNATQLAGTNPMTPHHQQMFPEPHGCWDRFNEGSGHVTLDLMQAPSSAFGLLSVRGKSKEEEEEDEEEEEEEECSGLWTHMV